MTTQVKTRQHPKSRTYVFQHVICFRVTHILTLKTYHMLSLYAYGLYPNAYWPTNHNMLYVAIHMSLIWSWQSPYHITQSLQDVIWKCDIICLSISVNLCLDGHHDASEFVRIYTLPWNIYNYFIIMTCYLALYVFFPGHMSVRKLYIDVNNIYPYEKHVICCMSIYMSSYVLTTCPKYVMLCFSYIYMFSLQRYVFS